MMKGGDMSCPQVKIAIRELEIILEGYQSVETLMSESDAEAVLAAKLLVPMNLFFESTLCLLRRSVDAELATKS